MAVLRVGSRHRPLLALLSAAQFVVVLDITIVNVALPTIESDLSFSRESLHWVVSAYALVFGGALLAGGRAADVAGARRMFLGGLVLFTVSSLLCGLSWTPELLVAARACQGFGAALIVPAALAVIADTFPEGRDRNAALGVWGSTGALAAASGVFLGGALTELVSWGAVFLVNVPVGAVAIALTPRLLSSERRCDRRRQFGAVRAALATAGLGALVGAFTAAGEGGWAMPPTIVLLALAGSLLALFVVLEGRSGDPLVPRSALRLPSVVLANVVGFLHGGAMLAVFLLLTLAMTDLVGLSPIETGAGLLATRVPSILWAKVAARVVGRIGTARTACVGMGAMAGGVALLAGSAHSSYVVDVLPGLLVLGLGIPFVFVSGSIAAFEGVPAASAGAAAGLLNSSRWIGGALGVAIASTLFLPDSSGLQSAGPEQLAAGLQSGFWAIVAVAVLGCAVTACLPAVYRTPTRVETRSP